jgi:DNA-binding SARP family transcriptional activator/nucleotide-binding universal stress UspA family protein
VEFRVLGPLEVLEDGRSLPLGGARQRALLAILLTHANEVVSTDRLIDQLWGGRPPNAALNTIQQYVSQLRKLLGAERIETRPPGYAIRLAPDELDLERFERLVEQGDAEALYEALSLWRGPPLADFAFEEFAGAEIARLEELRLVAVERRIDSDLELGRHVQLVGELERLISDYPLRERFRAQLMLALYRAGRQAEALAAYQRARQTLVDELGIEPGPALQELERAILRHDPALAAAGGPAPPARSILVVPQHPDAIDGLLAIAEPLARAGREVVLIEVVGRDDLREAGARLADRCDALLRQGVAARAAAFSSRDAGADLTKLAAQQEVDLLLLDGSPPEHDEGRLAPILETLLDRAPCDVGVLLKSGPVQADGVVLVPFGGADHDWAAVEVAAWFASATGLSLTLLGSEGGQHGDASRLLASASLLLQRALGIAAEPIIVPPGPEGVVSAADHAALVVLGLSARWREEGLGETRREVARRARPPVLLVRKGPRPSGVAPSETLTRFTWSLSSATRAS